MRSSSKQTNKKKVTCCGADLCCPLTQPLSHCLLSHKRLSHAGSVLCLSSCFSLKSSQTLSCPPPHISSTFHPFLSLTHLFSPLAPSSIFLSFLVPCALITSWTAFSCLPFYLSSHLFTSAHTPPSSSLHVPTQLAAMLCTHASP